jgi:hypothetical protein
VTTEATGSYRGYPEIDRPARNRRKLGDQDLIWDDDLEAALNSTISSGRAIVVELWKFHSSPAKGRLWSAGWKVKHRVLQDLRHVAAWIEPEKEWKEDLFD